MFAGKNILKRNGSVVDAAVASCFCLGVINMHSSGLGGGGMMLVYTRKNKTIEAFDYREKAPAKVREDLYADDFNKSRVGMCDRKYSVYSLSVNVVRLVMMEDV